MKLAKQAFLIALTMLALVFAMSAQTLRSADDDRNTAPTAGTGGTPGGPTGLFTIYDGQTLRKGEFTFSAAYSNYDRDPGNVDITEVPVSFQIGLSDNLELFFNTDALRRIKVNSPRNLSGFYLPNSKVRIGNAAVSPPAIILAPRGGGATQFPGSVFRPQGAPFTQYPFVGGSLGNFGLFFPSGPLFGFAANTFPTITAPIAGGNGADNFPGIGSLYGSILPGIVLATTNLGGVCGTGANPNNPACSAPSVFTIAPTYLPDAPLINREYGESAFNTFTVGGKWRWTGPNNPIGVGVIGFYRFYADQGTDFSGFNQLQRGSSPGGSWGDIGVVMFGDARLRKWLNISANLGYIYNSSIKGQFPSGEFTILDRPDEVVAGIGLDFPVNRYFQPIAEFKTTQYVGGRTPNAFENSPIEGLIGARIFPTRWMSLGGWYRHHFNQQDADSFEEANFQGTVNIAGTVPQTISTTFRGIPTGFNPSSDNQGFGLQVTVGRRNERQGQIINEAPNVNSVDLGKRRVILPCPAGTRSASGNCPDDMTVSVSTKATDKENDPLTYTYTVSGGRIVGNGANVSWDLTGVQPGNYTVTVGANDGCGICGQTKTETVTVERCPDCNKPCDCPSVSVSGPSSVTQPGESMTFTANVGGGGGNVGYSWTVTVDGQNVNFSGDGSPVITVPTDRSMSGKNVVAKVTISGQNLCTDCNKMDDEVGSIAEPPIARLIIEQGKAVPDQIKAAVDSFYIELNNNPSASGYIINYGTPKEVAKRESDIRKAIAFRKYDISRVTFVNGGNTGEGPKTKYWLVPAGADLPTP